MATPIRMPDLGTTVEEFRIMRWLVPEGAAVALGEELVEIETDKAVSALESTAKGVLLRQMVHEDSVAHTGDVLAYIGEPGETIPEQGQAAQPAVAKAAPVTAISVPKPAVASVVRNLAAKLGVDLAAVQGTGQGGVITREDVQRAARHRAPVNASARGQAAVARAVSRSWTEIPHAYFRVTIDMTAALAAREQSKASGMPVSYNALFLHAMAQALRRMPSAGARWQDGQAIPPEGIHLALAVDIDDALYLPVLHDCDQRTPTQLQVEIDETVALLGRQTLPVDRLAEGCMALSNLGIYPLDAFDPIIFPGHSGILALGAIQRVPVVIGEQLLIRPVLHATLAVDHRIINGRLAAAFLTDIKQQIEEIV